VQRQQVLAQHLGLLGPGGDVRVRQRLGQQVLLRLGPRIENEYSAAARGGGEGLGPVVLEQRLGPRVLWLEDRFEPVDRRVVQRDLRQVHGAAGGNFQVAGRAGDAPVEIHRPALALQDEPAACRGGGRQHDADGDGLTRLGGGRRLHAQHLHIARDPVGDGRHVDRDDAPCRAGVGGAGQEPRRGFAGRFQRVTGRLVAVAHEHDALAGVRREERQRHPDAVGDVRAFQDAHVQVVVDVVAGHRDRDDRGPAVEHHEPEAVVGRSGGGGLAKPVAQVLHLGASLQIGVLGQLRETLYGAAEIQDPDHGQVVVLADGRPGSPRG
jgi:hypothetical protein